MLLSELPEGGDGSSTVVNRSVSNPKLHINLSPDTLTALGVRYEILAEAAIERAAERAEALAEAHIASTLALVYPDAVGQGS